MFSVKIPDLTNANEKEMKKALTAFMREVNNKMRETEAQLNGKIKKLERELRNNG